MSHCLLINSRLDGKFYAEALNTENCLQNRLISKSLFPLYSNKSSMKNIGIFGYIANDDIDKGNRFK